MDRARWCLGRGRMASIQNQSYFCERRRRELAKNLLYKGAIAVLLPFCLALQFCASQEKKGSLHMLQTDLAAEWCSQGFFKDLTALPYFSKLLFICLVLLANTFSPLNHFVYFCSSSNFFPFSSGICLLSMVFMKGHLLNLFSSLWFSSCFSDFLQINENPLPLQ